MTSSSKKHSHAEEMLAALRTGFIADLPRKFEEFDRLVLSMKSEQDFTKHFDELFRHVHSLKGSAGTYGVHIYSTICHQFEEQLRLVDGDAGKLTEQLFDNWLKFVDLMRELLRDIEMNIDVTLEVQKQLDVLHDSVFANVSTGLIVASSRSIETICQSIFDKYNFNYSTTNNGYVALGQVLENNVDVLITSKEVAGLNGDALIASVRLSRLRNNNLTTVLLTSGSDAPTTRITDPDFIVPRDTQLMQNLSTIVSGIVSKKQHIRI